MQIKETIAFDDFAKLDLRIGTVIAAEKIEDSEKLVKLTVNVGEERRQIVAGIARAVDDLTTIINTQVVIVANLAPRKLMGVKSEGMLLAALDTDEKPVLLRPVKAVPNGAVVR